MSHSPAPWPSQDPSLLRPNREGLAGEHLEALAEVAGAVVGQPHLELLPLASGPEGGGGLFERKALEADPRQDRPSQPFWALHLPGALPPTPLTIEVPPHDSR